MSCSLQPTFTPQVHQKLEGKASYVIDGDTFYFSFDYGKFKATLSGVNVPGISEQGGKASYEFLRDLIHQKTIMIEYLKTDSEGRWVVNATLQNGQSIQDAIKMNLGKSLDSK